MKCKVILFAINIFAALNLFAQKDDLIVSREAFNKYIILKVSPEKRSAALLNLTLAKTAIDNAAVKAKTVTSPLFWALKGAIYANLAETDTVINNGALFYAAAEEALKNLKAANIKAEYKGLVDEANRNLAQYKLAEGVAEYGKGEYELAYSSFEQCRQIFPNDTSAIYYTALSATKLKKYPIAISNYSKLVTTPYSGNPSVYFELSNLYLVVKDTSAALTAIGHGLEQFPLDNNLRKRQIELFIKLGKQQEAPEKIERAIASEPNNKLYYYYKGLAYQQQANDKAKDKVKANNDLEIGKLDEAMLTCFQTSADAYKKALTIDPDFFKANLNIGYVLISPAIDIYNKANQLPGAKQKEYELAMNKANGLFDLARPYLLKAVKLNPTSIEALSNLKTYYVGKHDLVNVAEIQKIIDGLGIR